MEQKSFKNSQKIRPRNSSRSVHSCALLPLDLAYSFDFVFIPSLLFCYVFFRPNVPEFAAALNGSIEFVP